MSEEHPIRRFSGNGGQQGIFIRPLSPRLKREFKRYCKKRGYTMTAALQGLMRECVETERYIKTSWMMP